ncbi:MAG: hypothetical protein QE164_00605 [Candidatus Nezhaarchaeota archaeon]|nr:hypothetical protein [Candidatus Nezhaarchaeota archaeon]
MEVMSVHEKVNALKKIVGPENVIDSKPALLIYSKDASPMRGKVPIAVVRPSSTEEVREIVLWANKTRTPYILEAAAQACGAQFLSLMEASS